MENSTAMFEIPHGLADRIAVDRPNLKMYVDKSVVSHPLFLTCLAKNKFRGLEFAVEQMELDEVAKLRNNGMRSADGVDLDMDVRARAVEIIVSAAAYGASDVHIMLRGQHAEIQIVVKGGLRVLERITHDEGEAITRAIYQGIAKTRDASFQQLDFQNAQIPGAELPAEAGLTSVRIVRGPCYPEAQGGAFMTMRLQYSAVQTGGKKALPQLALPRQPAGQLRLGSMGYTPKQVEKIMTLLDAPDGVVIYTGPTGSGKTTSMYEAMLHGARAKPHRRVVTVEDPVEYPMEWAVQMAITGARNDAETGAAFGERIRVALRMAPNMILLGELRGPDVAVAALEAAVTGHQVWTTMHVTDPFLFVERLELMDRNRLERRVFCDHKIVRGVVAQRLLPRLCPACSVALAAQPEVLSERIRNALTTWGDTQRVRVRGPGCKDCGHDGSVGRVAVAEVVVTDAALMRDFIQSGSEVARENHRRKHDADPSMLEAAIAATLRGEVDPRAVEDAVDLIEARDRRRT